MISSRPTARKRRTIVMLTSCSPSITLHFAGMRPKIRPFFAFSPVFLRFSYALVPVFSPERQSIHRKETAKIRKIRKSGNFFAIRSNWIPTFMEIPTSTNHASVSIIRYCPEFEMVTLNRSKRFEGKSKMNLASLALHGYGALAVYADIVFSRLLILVALIATMLYSTGGIIFLIKIFRSDLLLPGWSSNVILILIGFATLLLFNFFSSTLLLLKINSQLSRKVVG